MKQRLLSSLLALCMVLALLPGAAQAANISYPVTGGNIYFDTGIIAGAITGCDKGVTEAIIPSEINGVPVTSIWEYAFADCGNLTGVTIPDSVTYIARFAFQNCSSLVSVVIPNGVTSIEWGTFSNCYSLTNVTIPSSVTGIGTEAFWGCYNLTGIFIPDSVISINDFAFEACTGLKDVYYGGSESQWKQITRGNYGFESLDNAVIHYNSAASDAGFDGADVEVGSKGIIYPVTGGNLHFWVGSDAKGYIVDCDETVTEAIIPSEINGVSVTMIAGEAFENCSNLVSVTIPDGVTAIGNSAFKDCSSLTNITIPKSVTSIGTGGVTNGVFEDCTSLTNVIILGNISTIKEFTFWNCGISSVSIPGSVTTIEGDAFYFGAPLKDVYYGGSETQWNQVAIGFAGGGPSPLLRATIHYNSTMPSAPSTPAPTTPTQSANAVLSPQKLTVDGANVNCEKYNINGSNYFKLRDLAYVLNGSASQFEVGFDAATSTVTITTGAAYTSNGSELVTGVDNASTAQPSRQTILINGAERGDLTVYNIGGSNFFKLRDLGDALDFDVDFNEASNTAIVRSAQG